MRVRRSSVLWAAGLLAVVAQTGCEPARALTSNLVLEPLKWDRYSDGVGRHIRDASLAEEAWEEVCARDGEIYSRHYRRGFLEGFRDYLNNGGTGDPPTLPPRSYWRIYYQSPEGHEAIQDWFDGFRHGSSVAKASGIRGYVTVPVSSVPPPDNQIEESDEPIRPPSKEPEKVPAPNNVKPPDSKEGPVKPPVITPPKTADGRPMPPPVPPIIQVERMIAPPIPNKQQQPPR